MIPFILLHPAFTQADSWAWDVDNKHIHKCILDARLVYLMGVKDWTGMKLGIELCRGQKKLGIKLWRKQQYFKQEKKQLCW